ncbi:MAG TPA: L,D-transpeptidase family protein [Parafilimonas sp.]|nr:L,D-transpeptidase family protein [Parafilimonas sp.]
MRRIFIYTLGVIILIFSCKSKHHKEIQVDQSITKKTSFNNLFIDSNTINRFLNKYPEYNKFNKQYSDFYKLRNYQCAWFDTSGMGEQAYNFMNLIASAADTYNDSSLYNKKLANTVDEFKTDTSGRTIKTTQDIVETELKLTGQFFLYASKIYGGTDINIKELGWFIPRKKINLTVLLDSLIANKSDIKNAEIPLSEAYKKLLDYLPAYRKISEPTRWDTIAYPEKGIHKGYAAPDIQLVKQRLFALGDLTDNDSTELFDSSLFKAVKNFQARMGLRTDGVIGRSFIKQLNIPPSKRIEQILVNLERLRWMPEMNENSNYIIVNIPEYKMYVFDSGKLQFDMNVVVGASATSTVIFTGNLKYVVFSPYWNIPESIVKKEIMPGMARNKNYLVEHNMEIYGKPNKDTPSVRQLPGPDNALGRVKFLFPNNFDIYFHDTNNPNAFNASNRNLSHGCIRLSKPKEFAMYLLSYDTTTYSSHKIDSLMNLDEEKWVTLKKPIPVMISYYTAFVDAKGRLNFRNDIYKHDSAMAAKLFTPNNNLMAVK